MQGKTLQPGKNPGPLLRIKKVKMRNKLTSLFMEEVFKDQEEMIKNECFLTRWGVPKHELNPKWKWWKFWIKEFTEVERDNDFGGDEEFTMDIVRGGK